jgi:hypothetical protein
MRGIPEYDHVIRALGLLQCFLLGETRGQWVRGGLAGDALEVRVRRTSGEASTPSFRRGVDDLELGFEPSYAALG